MVSDSVYWERTGGHRAGELNYRLSLKMFCISHSESREQKNKIVRQICRSYCAGCVCMSLLFVFSCVLSSLYLQVSVPPNANHPHPGPRPFGSSHCGDERQDIVLAATCLPSNGNEAPLQEVAPAVWKIAHESHDVKDGDLYFGSYMPALFLKCWLVPLDTKLVLSAFESPNSAKDFFFFCLPDGILWRILHFIGLEKKSLRFAQGCFQWRCKVKVMRFYPK